MNKEKLKNTIIAIFMGLGVLTSMFFTAIDIAGYFADVGERILGDNMERFFTFAVYGFAALGVCILPYSLYALLEFIRKRKDIEIFNGLWTYWMNDEYLGVLFVNRRCSPLALDAEMLDAEILYWAYSIKDKSKNVLSEECIPRCEYDIAIHKHNPEKFGLLIHSEKALLEFSLKESDGKTATVSFRHFDIEVNEPKVDAVKRKECKEILRKGDKITADDILSVLERTNGNNKANSENWHSNGIPKKNQQSKKDEETATAETTKQA